MDSLSLNDEVVVDGWTLLVLTNGGYSRSGDDFRTEIFWIVGDRRVFSRPQMVINHPHGAEAEMAHEELLLELRGGGYELKFARGQVTLVAVPLAINLARFFWSLLQMVVAKIYPPKLPAA